MGSRKRKQMDKSSDCLDSPTDSHSAAQKRVKIYTCDICHEFTSKYSTSLKKHKSSKHNVDVKWFQCQYCPSQFREKFHVKRHEMQVHDKHVNWIRCDVEGCNRKFKLNYRLMEHKAYTHGIDTRWYVCDVGDCRRRFKRNSHLVSHKKNTHNIGVKWQKCDVGDCTKQFKTASNLSRHKAFVHDIGKHKCDFCFNLRNSSIPFRDDAGLHKICRKCYNIKTGKHSRVEKVWSDHLDKHVGTDFLLGSDQSLRAMGGCSLRRPDKFYASSDLIEIDECDEHQHMHSNGSYLCEQKRISEIYDEVAITGKKMVVIRWNPDGYSVPCGYTKKTRKERLGVHVALKQHLRRHPPEALITVFYLFYSKDNPRVTSAFPHHFIFDVSDIGKLFHN